MIIYGIVEQYGTDGLIVATILAGIILVIMGICRFGSLIKYIPYTITTGFTCGIAVTLFVGQLKDFFGLEIASVPSEFLNKVIAYVQNISTINLTSTIIGVVAIIIMLFWPKVTDKIPGSLIAIIITTAIVYFAKLPVNTIGSVYGELNSAFPTFHAPALSMKLVQEMISPAFTIAILAGIESLLSAVVSDGMIGDTHKSNAELIGQGLGNIFSGLFGGIPATGAIARTAANIKNGGRTPVAGMVHSITLVIVLVVLMPFAGMIPMPTIAAILFVVAYNMCQWRTFVHMLKTAPKSDIIVLIVTFILTVVFDLVVAIEIGMVIACLLFIKRMSEETHVDSWVYVDDDTPEIDDHLARLPLAIRVYEITGPLFFGASDAIEHIVVKDFTKCLILRMRSVPALDSTALNALKDLVDTCEKKELRSYFLMSMNNQ